MLPAWLFIETILGCHRCCAAALNGPRAQRSAECFRRKHGQPRPGRRDHALPPVFVPGGLLSIGDGHAAQGYGEVCLSAIETSLKGEIQVVLHKNKLLKQPRAETPTHFMTMGLNADLDEAAKIATREMLDWVVE